MSFEEWKEYKLGDFVEVQNGYAFKASDFSDIGIPVIKIKNISNSKVNLQDAQFYNSEISGKLKQFVIKQNDILISMTGSHINQIASAVGKVGKYQFENPALLNQRVGKVYSLNKEICDEGFLYYFLNRFETQFELASCAGGSANQANISPTQIKNLKINLPSLTTQRRIASILSSLDDKIELNRQTNKTLEAIAQALFKEWFVDFNFPGATGEMQESELGEIPKGWKVGSISDLFEISKENIIPSSFPSVEFLHYSLPAFDEGRKPTKDLGSEILSNKFKVKSNSILVSKLNPRIPRVWPITHSNDQCICSTEFQVFCPKKEYLFSFGSTLFLQNQIIEIMKSRATGTSSSHQRIRPQDMLDIQLIIPDDETLQHFDKAIKNFYNLIVTNEEQTQTLTQLQDSLLPKLMKGEISVAETENKTASVL